jgi:regulator of sigma E protease
MTGILLGLFGLGIVVFVHEAGHFLAAKAVGIEVEAFSIGWGRPLFSKTIGRTDYRIGMFPIGGYCKMKGEELFRKALAEKADHIEAEKGSLFSVTPIKRIFTYAAGPLSNLLFAMIVLSIIWYAGFTFHTFENRIVLLSDYPSLFGDELNPADQAGLKTGDRIIKINNTDIDHYADIQETLAPLAEREITITVSRNNREVLLTVTPALDTSTGIGRIGVSAWIEPTIASVQEDSAAYLAGLEPGDTIISADGLPVFHYLDLYAALESSPGKIEIEYRRENSVSSSILIPDYDESGAPVLGVSFSGLTIRSEKLSLPASFLKGSGEAVGSFFLTIKGIKSLFSGVSARDAVSGPIRITYMLGEVAGRGFNESFGTGLSTLFRFLSLISVALCFGNLLPIPALDGGLILLSFVEIFRGRQVSPKAFYRFQTIGFFIIIMILIFTTFGDITYLMKG